MGSQGDAVRERLWTRLCNGAQGSNPLRGRGSGQAGPLQNCWDALWFNVFMRSQKEKTKNFKSQIIKYLESLLQSQHQVSPRQKSWSWSWLQLTLGIPDKATLQFPNLFISVFSSWSNTGRLSYLKLKRSLNPPAALQTTDRRPFLFWYTLPLAFKTKEDVCIVKGDTISFFFFKSPLTYSSVFYCIDNCIFSFNHLQIFS